MARKHGELPRIRLHKQTGLAFVECNNRRIYLGEHGSAQAEAKYWEVVGQQRQDVYAQLDALLNAKKTVSVADHNNGAVFGAQQGFFERYPNLPTVWYYPSLLPQQIPEVSAVYIVLNAGNVVSYVGETQNMRRRYAEHKRWMKQRYKFSWIEVAQSERLFVQAYFIASLRPTKNKLPGTRDCPDEKRVAVLQPVKLMVRPKNKSVAAPQKESSHGR